MSFSVTCLKQAILLWFFLRRVHLALKAYQELLMTLDSMDRSGNRQLVESAKVIKSRSLMNYIYEL